MLKKFKAAAIQAAPILLDRDATIKKASSLIIEAASNGANLIVFPETWVPGYPVWTNANSRWDYTPAKNVYRRLYENAVDIPEPVTEFLGKAAKAAQPIGTILATPRNPDDRVVRSLHRYMFCGHTSLSRGRSLPRSHHPLPAAFRRVRGLSSGDACRGAGCAKGRGLVCARAGSIRVVERAPGAIRT